jgi:hypothetical protein
MKKIEVIRMQGMGLGFGFLEEVEVTSNPELWQKGRFLGVDYVKGERVYVCACLDTPIVFLEQVSDSNFRLCTFYGSCIRKVSKCPFVRGQEIEVSNKQSGDYTKRTFIVYAEGATNPYVCVGVDSDEDYKTGKPFNTGSFRFAKEIHELKYRPFANAEEFEPYKDKWIKMSNGTLVRCNGYDSSRIGVGNLGLVPYSTAFEQSTFADGTPFGIKE